jgi:hypothetical protein
LTYYCSTDRNEWTKGFDARFGLCTEAEARKFFTVHSEIAYVNEDAVGYIRNFNLNLAISAISAQNLAIFANFPIEFAQSKDFRGLRRSKNCWGSSGSIVFIPNHEFMTLLNRIFQ